MDAGFLFPFPHATILFLFQLSQCLRDNILNLPLDGQDLVDLFLERGLEFSLKGQRGRGFGLPQVALIFDQRHFSFNMCAVTRSDYLGLLSH